MSTSKPRNIDAQRILAIMDELKEKLTFLSVVTPQVLEGLQSEEGLTAQELLGPDLMKCFQDQIRLEADMVNQATDGNFGHAEDNEDVRDEVKALQKNTLELCRKMKAVPNIVQELRNFQETRPGAVIQFLKTLADMQELTLKRLTTTVEEERSKNELLEHYKVKEAEASKRKQQLERELHHIRRERDRAQSQRTEVLTKLKADLLDVKDSKQEEMMKLRKRYEERMKGYQEQFNQRREDYTRKIETLKQKNANLRKQSQEEESGKKKAVKRYETDVENVIKQYDDRIKEMAYNLHEHQEHFAKEQRQLTELREHFQKVDFEKECISAEEGLAEARRSKLKAEAERKNEASAMVQAFWRGISQREAYQQMKKNKKKKGKGKKGKR